MNRRYWSYAAALLTLVAVAAWTLRALESAADAPPPKAVNERCAPPSLRRISIDGTVAISRRDPRAAGRADYARSSATFRRLLT